MTNVAVNRVAYMVMKNQSCSSNLSLFAHPRKSFSCASTLSSYKHCFCI